MLHFATHVRTRDTRNLVIHNRTNQLWMLRPVIDGEYWSGPDTITVEPQQSKNYELTYRPLTMTQEGKKHLVWVVPLSFHRIAVLCVTLSALRDIDFNYWILGRESFSIVNCRLKYDYFTCWRSSQVLFPESFSLFTLGRYRVSCTI